MIKYFGKEGRGPDEFLFPSELSRFSGKPNVIGINNSRIFSFNELSIENLLTSNSNYTISTTSKLNNGYSRIIKVGDTAFLGTGVFPNGRFGLSDSDGNFLFSTYDCPFQESFESIDTQSVGMGYQSNLTSHPDEEMVEVATAESANIDIISISKDTIQVIRSIHQYPPIIDDNSSAGLLSVQYLPENRRVYEFLTSTSNYIYALYSGTKRSEGSTKYSAGEVVFKYDWSGNAIRQYMLDRSVKLIAIDKQDEIMYAMSSDSLGQSSLHRYNLR